MKIIRKSIKRKEIKINKNKKLKNIYKINITNQ